MRSVRRLPLQIRGARADVMQAYGEQCQTRQVVPQAMSFRFMQGISIRAILLATLAVFGIDFVSSLVLFAMFDGPPLDAPREQIEAALDALNEDAGYLFTALVFGTASTVVGGYLTARLAPTLPYYNALVFGVLGLAIGIPLSEGLPGWFRVLGLGLGIPAALFGARLSKGKGGIAR